MVVQRALISVFDKTGIVEFAKRLAALKIEILSTGGTAKLLRESGVAVRDVSDFTGWPEMLGGRVKTLHPKVHGGLLFRRGHAEDQKQAAEHGIAPIDLVVVNLYPFEATAAKTGLMAEELIENIDIGGPTMLRASAKNFERVTVVTDPADFERGAGEIESAGETTRATRVGLAPEGFAAARQLQGKELSYNNLVDLEAARSLAAEFKNPAAVIIKHNNPCGAAEQTTLLEAYLKALACDPVSAFGGVLAFNRVVDAPTAEEVAKLFVECIAAPGFADRAKEILAAKKNLRLLELPASGLEPERELLLKRILGGMLVQQPDLGEIKDDELRTVTKRVPTAEEMHAMRFAWKVAKHVKSNALVFAKDGATLGVGAGQMSRVDSVKIAVMKAPSSLAGTVVASDAFFPFPDGVEESAKAGATAVIQPGGSVRDPDVIAAADRLGLAMVFTGMRHFLH